MNHLNDLNLKLQGKDKFIWDSARIVTEFTLKLKTFKAQLEENDFSFYPNFAIGSNKIDDTFRFVQIMFFFHRLKSLN